MTARVLIVDDDPVQRRLLDNMVRKFGHEPVVAESGDAAAALLTGGETLRLRRARSRDARSRRPRRAGADARGRLAMPVIVQTAHGGIDNVVSAMRAGAVDFVVKPVGAERLQVSLATRWKRARSKASSPASSAATSGTLTFKDIVTRSPNMLAVLRSAEKAAGSAIPVLIEGESGVGKELIARAIHGQASGAPSRSSRSIAARSRTISWSRSCSATRRAPSPARPRSTPASSSKPRAARCSSTRSASCRRPRRSSCLRAIQEGEVEPVGGRKPVKVDVRIISATNRNLIDDVKSGRFREDLFYRLHVFPIAVPPLRERAEDIPDLVRHFLARFAAEEGKRVRAISGEALALLGRHRWPGNVRQLENAVFRAVVLAEGDRSASTNSRRSRRLRARCRCRRSRPCQALNSSSLIRRA